MCAATAAAPTDAAQAAAARERWQVCQQATLGVALALGFTHSIDSIPDLQGLPAAEGAAPAAAAAAAPATHADVVAADVSDTDSEVDVEEVIAQLSPEVRPSPGPVCAETLAIDLARAAARRM